MIELTTWIPSYRSWRPPRKPLKYALYTLFHYLGVFGTAAFMQVSAQADARTVGSLLIIPAHYRYPFMSQNDIQFTYVMVDPMYRGQGIAWQMMFDATRDFNADIWYVTDEKNASSIGLAEKAGFILFGIAHKKGHLFTTLEMLKC